MLEGKSSPAGSGHATPGYSYPGDLARYVRDRWRDVPDQPGGVNPLPDAAALEGFFAACYQASMLREEERPVVFRAILAEPALFDPDGLPDQFSGFLEELTERHEAARSRARELSGERWAPLEPSLPRRIAERMMKRVISVLRDARHGGTE